MYVCYEIFPLHYTSMDSSGLITFHNKTFRSHILSYALHASSTFPNMAYSITTVATMKLLCSSPFKTNWSWTSLAWMLLYI